MNSRIKERPSCQVAGCLRPAATPVDVELPDGWEATPLFSTLTVSVRLCSEDGHDVARRTQAAVKARSEFHELVSIIEQAVRDEKSLQLRLEASMERCDQLETENADLRYRLQEAETELRRVHKALSCHQASPSTSAVVERMGVAIGHCMEPNEVSP
jgi:hypothetical protein